MKKILLLISIVTAFSYLSAQEDGEVYGKIFSNFHHSIAGETDRAFEIRRAYLGYDHIINSNFSGHIKLDIGSPDDQSVYALLKRYAYFKNAFLKYQKNRLTINFGLVDNFQFKMQEKFWGHRYIYRSFMDEHDFGSSADIGVTAKYEFSEKLSAEFGILNGEGYNSLQSDNRFLTEGAVTYTVNSYLTLRGFYSISTKTITTHTYAFFLGVNPVKDFQLGGELNFIDNMNDSQHRDAMGYSVYGIYDFDEQWQIFGRFDKLKSNKLSGEENPWNIFNDGSAVIAGIQYKPVPEIAMSVNYQDWVPWAANLETESLIFLNMLYKL